MKPFCLIVTLAFAALVAPAADVPKMRAALARELIALEDPSWCVADCFQAAVKFLRGETRHLPDNSGLSVTNERKCTTCLQNALKLP